MRPSDRRLVEKNPAGRYRSCAQIPHYYARDGRRKPSGSAVRLGSPDLLVAREATDLAIHPVLEK